MPRAAKQSTHVKVRDLEALLKEEYAIEGRDYTTENRLRDFIQSEFEEAKASFLV